MTQPRSRALPALLAAVLTTVLWVPAVNAQSVAVPDTIVVRMIDKGVGQWRFDPATVTAPQGSVVRFVQEDVAPHNVEFKSAPKGARLDDIRMGPFLLQKGQTYDIAIDDRFPHGDYAYVCTPHAALGMKGVLAVTDGLLATH